MARGNQRPPSDAKTGIVFCGKELRARDFRRIQKLIDSDPDGVNAPAYYMELARIYEESGKQGKAKQVYQEVASRFPNSPEAEKVARRNE